jgi:hypothetical protein
LPKQKMNRVLVIWCTDDFFFYKTLTYPY